MWKKIRPRQRDAFLRALAETGNVTLAAEHARLSRSWVVKWRGLDPDFEAACRAALRQAQDRLGSAEKRGAGKKWRYLDGAELVVKRGNGRRTQIARARARQWTPRTEARFLAVVAATCNARAGCAEAGMSVSSLHTHLKQWPDFARRYAEAVAAGYERIDRGLIAHCIAFLDPELDQASVTDPPMTPMNVDDAIRIARVHDRRRREARQDAEWARGLRTLGRRRGGGARSDAIRGDAPRHLHAARGGCGSRCAGCGCWWGCSPPRGS